MALVTTIIVGLIVGALARWIMPGDQKMGWIMTILLGINWKARTPTYDSPTRRRA